MKCRRGCWVRYRSKNEEKQYRDELGTGQLEDDCTVRRSRKKTQRYWGDGLESDQIRSRCDPRGYKCKHNRHENLIWSLNYTTKSTTRTET